MTDAPTIRLATPPTVSDEIKQAVIEDLKAVLEKAERGEIIGLMIVAERTDGQWQDWRSGVLSFCEALGMLTVSMHRWVHSYIEMAKKDKPAA